MNKSIVILLLLYISVIGCSSTAGEYDGLPGAYLRFGSSARSLGMGGVDVVMGTGSSAAYGNPAQLGFLGDMEVSATHAALFEGTRYNVVTAIHPWTPWGGFAVGITNLACGGFEERGPTDNRYSVKGEEFSNSQIGVLAGWAMELSRWGFSTSLAGRGTLVNHSILNQHGMGIGVDFGLEHRMIFPYVHRLLAPAVIGVHVSNLLEPSVKIDQASEKYPLHIHVGLGYSISDIAKIMAQVSAVGDGARLVRTGVEIKPRDEFRLRFGWNDTELSGGVGLFWNAFALDYAVAWHEELSTSHRVSLSWHRHVDVSMNTDGDVDRNTATRWIVQNYDDPESARLAHILAATVDESHAGRYYTFVIGHHPLTEWAAYGLNWFGDDAYISSKWSAAESRYLSLYEHPHRDVSATEQTWFRLGDSAERLEHWNTSVEGYELVIASPRASALKEEAYFRAGGIYYVHLADYLSAIRVYESAIKLYPSHDLADAYYRLGRSYGAMERWQSSVDRLSYFIEQYSMDYRRPDALFWLGRGLYELGLPEDALPKLEEVVEDYPNHAIADDAILYKGHCRRLMGGLSEARLEYSRVVKDYPARDAAPWAQLALAKVLEDEGSLELARREFQRFLANYPDHPGKREAQQHVQSLEGYSR